MSEFGTLKACSGKKYSSESPAPIVVDIRAGAAVVDEVVGAGSGSAGIVIAYRSVVTKEESMVVALVDVVGPRMMRGVVSELELEVAERGAEVSAEMSDSAADMLVMAWPWRHNGTTLVLWIDRLSQPQPCPPPYLPLW